MLVLSAPAGADLEPATAALAGHLRRHPETDLGHLAFTLQTGNRNLEHRRILVCRDVADALPALEGTAPGRLETFAGEPGERRVSFLLPGFGDHYPDMALGLYREEPSFRRLVDECCERLRPELGFDLREQLFPGLTAPSPAAPSAPGGKRDLRSLIRQKPSAPEPQKPAGMSSTAVHAAVFVVEIALARLLMEWGIRPRAMLGYSLGEYSAACLAGVFSLADGLTLVARRARLIEELPAGAMLAVPLPVEEIEPLLRGGVGIAAINGPAHQVVAGPLAAVEALEAELTARGVLCRRLQAHHAGHSSMLEPIAGRLRELVAGFKLQPPEIPFVSNVTGTWIRPEEAIDPDYWVRHLLGTVRFGDGLTHLFGLSETGSALLEVGPGQSLTSFAKRHPAAEAGQASLTFSTLRAAHSPQPDRAFLLSTLGRLWMAGVPVDWVATHPEGRKRLDLPSEVFGGSVERAERIHAWPNGMRIVAQTQTEAEHFYQDIFEKRIYLRHGVTLREGACVFDVGSNIGTFLLFAHQMSPGALIHSFEPAPPLFAKLRRNAELNGVAARLFNLGVSDHEGTARFTFYPRSSGMSSFHADKEQEKDILRRMMETEREAGVEGVGELMGFAEDLLEERFRSETFECRLRPLSDVIAECGVEWIDLLKIDVQKAELEVLGGLREEHWPRIGQIVMEVHDLDGRLDRIVRMLEERGFRVAVEQDELLTGSVLYNLFAVREGAAGPGEEARERQRQAFQSDLRAEAARSARTVFGTAYAAPTSDLERTLAKIWQRALHVGRVGIDDDFFDLGGTSLSGLQVAQEIQERLGVEISPVTLFAAPTVRALARSLEA